MKKRVQNLRGEISRWAEKNYFAYELKCFWSPYNEKFLIWKEFLMRKKDEKFHRLYSLLTAINFPFSLSSALDYSLFIISRAIHIAYIMPSTIESHSHVFVFLERIFFLFFHHGYIA